MGPALYITKNKNSGECLRSAIDGAMITFSVGTSYSRTKSFMHENFTHEHFIFMHENAISMHMEIVL